MLPVCTANQLTDFSIMLTLASNGLKNENSFFNNSERKRMEINMRNVFKYVL